MIDGLLDDLRAASLGAEVVERTPNIIFVKVLQYPLPDMTCVEAVADIALPIPTTFPAAAPYGFFALTPVTSRRAAWRNVSAAAPFPSALFFSRKCPSWNPSKDRVHTYLAYVNAWLEQRA